MKVSSPLANMDVRIGEIRRDGHQLKLKAAPGSSIDADITVSAGEVLGILAKILTSGPGLVFVLGLPWFWLREKMGSPAGAERTSGATDGAAPRVDINKPW